ncbi:MAG: TIGR01777 family oxidoreductase [Candidatus Sericytochromatia bacterium]|nr:TIGR01777 family oxidoreductase [Candidatus Sericytochromatia bacterium]
MTTRTFESTLEAPASAVWDWHVRPGAFLRLNPPFDPARIVEGGLVAEGSRAKLQMQAGPIPVEWVAEHRRVVPGVGFDDVQIRGPFASWEHQHRVLPVDGQSSRLVDHLSYELPLGGLGELGGGAMVARKVERAFAYRHRILREDLAAHARYSHTGPLTLAVTGASGTVGRALVPYLTTGGHRVIVLKRPEAASSELWSSLTPPPGVFPGVLEGTWDPGTSHLGLPEDVRLDAVIHLAGEPVGDKLWSDVQRMRIRTSRVEATRGLAEALAALPHPPKVLVCASAIGWYGDRGEVSLDEAMPAGRGFLADVCQAWEAAAEPARAAGIRTVHTRFGIILSPDGGALGRMLPIFRSGLGGNLGSGRQFWSWVSLEDVVGALHHALATPELSGPVNVVAPSAVTHAVFSEVLARVLGRPRPIAHVPALVLRATLGAFADEMLLASARVVPDRLIATGYRYRLPELERALAVVLGQMDWRRLAREYPGKVRQELAA